MLKRIREHLSVLYMRAEVKCPLCNAGLAMLQDATVEDAVKLFEKHLPSHKLSEIYDFMAKNASQVFPTIAWDHGD